MRSLPILALSLVGLAITPAAWAENDKGHGHGHGKGPEVAVVAPSGRIVVTDRDRLAVHSFYRTEFVEGRCPPGLAKKHNGCLPPGLAARAWTLGAPLPPSVAFYPLPSALLAQLTPAPAGYQYVRIDDDVVLLSTGPRVAVQRLASLSDLQAAQPLIAEPDRNAIGTYYLSEYRAGNCPDGLMRTDAGCASKPLWALGAPLDSAVPIEALPQPLLAQLAPPPDDHQYIRLGDHILLMMVSSRMIRADVLDLGRIGLAPASMVTTGAPAAVVVPRPVEVVPQAVVVPGGGSCPPGLAKKNNGCLPPGHAK
jgi:hypothetical protein